MTTQEAVINVLAHAAGDAMSAAEVVDELERAGIPRSSTTVSSVLRGLANRGVLARFYRRDDCGGGLRYEYKIGGGEWT